MVRVILFLFLIYVGSIIYLCVELLFELFESNFTVTSLVTITVMTFLCLERLVL